MSEAVQVDEPPLMALDRNGANRHPDRRNDYSLEFLYGHCFHTRRMVSVLLGMRSSRDNSILNNCCLWLVSRLANL